MNKQLSLFHPDINTIQRPEKCRQCHHFFRTQYYGYRANYCRAIKSGRTDNGFLKVKALNPACQHFKPKEIKHENK